MMGKWDNEKNSHSPIVSKSHSQKKNEAADAPLSHARGCLASEWRSSGDDIKKPWMGST